MSSPPLLPIAHTPSRRRRILWAACYFFFLLGIFAIGYAGYVFADSRAYQSAELRKLEQPAPLLQEPHLLAEGDTLGEILVPRLNLDVVVVQGDSPKNLRRAVAHLPNSPLPGELGNVALAGHRDTFFRPLRNILVGDKIIFKTRARSFEYIVETFHVVDPTDLHVLDSTPAHELTLLTCFPFYYVGPAPKRFVVRARESEPAP